MAGNLTPALALVVRLAQIQDTGVDRDEYSALAKSVTTSRMRETVALAREVSGGNGILPENNVARYFADAEAIYSYEGDAGDQPAHRGAPPRAGPRSSKRAGGTDSMSQRGGSGRQRAIWAFSSPPSSTASALTYRNSKMATGADRAP
jgi:hypothetical protein